MDKHYLKYVHTEGGMTKCGGSKGSCVDQITDKGEGAAIICLITQTALSTPYFISRSHLLSNPLSQNWQHHFYMACN